MGKIETMENKIIDLRKAEVFIGGQIFPLAGDSLRIDNEGVSFLLNEDIITFFKDHVTMTMVPGFTESSQATGPLRWIRSPVSSLESNYPTVKDQIETIIVGAVSDAPHSILFGSGKIQSNINEESSGLVAASGLAGESGLAEPSSLQTSRFPNASGLVKMSGLLEASGLMDISGQFASGVLGASEIAHEILPIHRRRRFVESYRPLPKMFLRGEDLYGRTRVIVIEGFVTAHEIARESTPFNIGSVTLKADSNISVSIITNL